MLGIASHASPIWVMVAGAITLAICLNGFKIGTRLSVLAEPDSHRKLHGKPTPQVGGLAILSGFLVWTIIVLFQHSAIDRTFLHALLLSVCGVGAVGFADDQNGLSPVSRTVLLLAFLGVAFALAPDLISQKLNWGSFDVTNISVWAYLALMSVATVGVVNAVNMADGQDGIAGSMFVVWSGCLYLVSSGTSASIAAVLVVLSLIFLVFNLRGKLFLGDCGSYGVTFVIGLLATLAHARGLVTLETITVWFFIPVVDCIRLLVSRALRGHSPFLGDRDHFHHRLEDKLGKQQGWAIYTAAVAVSSLLATLAPRFAIVCLCFLSAFYFSFAWLTEANVASRESSDEPQSTPDNVVEIGSERKQRRARG